MPQRQQLWKLFPGDSVSLYPAASPLADRVAFSDGADNSHPTWCQVGDIGNHQVLRMGLLVGNKEEALGMKSRGCRLSFLINVIACPQGIIVNLKTPHIQLAFSNQQSSLHARRRRQSHVTCPEITPFVATQTSKIP